MSRAHEGTYDLDVINDDLDHIDHLVAKQTTWCFFEDVPSLRLHLFKIDCA